MSSLHQKLSEIASFHGHRCPGIAYGLRIALAALKAIDHEKGDEIITLSESDRCPVDAVQYIAGSTLGNGRLYLNLTGNQIYSFWNKTKSNTSHICRRNKASDITNQPSPNS